MRKSLYLATAVLLAATLVFIAASVAGAESANTKMGAIKNGDSYPKAAPAKSMDLGLLKILSEIQNTLSTALRSLAPAGAVTVEFYKITDPVNPITEITSGSPVVVVGRHTDNPVTPPYRGVCIFLFPRDFPEHKNTMVMVKEYTGPDTIDAAPYFFFIPPSLKYPWVLGEATAIVKVDGVGWGYGKLTIN